MASVESFSLMTCLVVALSQQVKCEIGGYFSDVPPEDYYHRRLLTDCPSRFYAHLPDHIDLLDFDRESVNAGDNPHMAAIGWITNDTVEYWCTGVLISPKYVLTTANCIFKSKRRKPDMVRLGDDSWLSKQSEGQIQQIGIRRYKQHPRFRQGRHYFDVALIELNAEVSLNGIACPACLWLEEELPTEEMQAISFGAANFNDIGNGEDIENTLSPIDMNTCYEQFPTFKKSLLDREFCAGSNCLGSCKRNCVGALQIKRPDIDGSIIPLIVGVESFTTSWSNQSIGLFTRVVSFRDWIEREIGHSMDYQTCSRISKCSGRKRESSPIVLHKGYTSRVGLIWNDSDLEAHQCGATLIDYRFAVTSAFCVQKRQTKPKFIVIENTREIVPIDQIFIHPEFCHHNPQNDIALIKLSKFLKQNEHLVPSCLWLDGTKSEDWTVKVSAYRTSFAERDSYRKDNYDQYTIDFNPDEIEECGHEWQNRLQCLNNSLSLVPGVCNIDYGGPVYNSSGKIIYLHGIVSHLSLSCEKDLLLTKIDVHIPWIMYNMFDHSNERVDPDLANNFVKVPTVPHPSFPTQAIGLPSIPFIQLPFFKNLHLPSIGNLLSGILQRSSFLRNIFSRETYF
nr:uncharacterized protein LOC109622340 isoform X1 [Aedes albopictus]